MSHYNKLIVCCMISGMTALSSANAEMEMDPYPGDEPGPYRRWSPELQQVNPEPLYGMDAEGYARMSLDDPLLKYAYTKIFMRSLGDFQELEPMDALALADMRKRGESASPVLLKLLEENQETGFEIALLCFIDQVGTVSIDPFIDYARNLLRNRTQTMSGAAAGSAAILISKHGSLEDAELLRWVMKERPYVADSVTRKLDGLLQRLNQSEPKTRPDLKGKASMSEEKAERSSTSTLKPTSTNGSEQSQSNGWIAWAVLGIFLTFILGRLLKNRSR